MPNTITLNPTSNSSPDSGQGAISDVTNRKPTAFDNSETEICDPVEDVSSPTNTGHGSTTSSASGGSTQCKAIGWDGFAAAGVTPTLVKLKLDWSEDGNLNGSSPPNVDTLFEIDYSLDGGTSNLNVLISHQEIENPTSGSSEATLSNSQNLTLVRVFSELLASSAPGHSCDVTGAVSDIRVELTHSVSGAAVTSPSNTGHGSTVASSSNDVLAYKTCVWTGFPASPITPELVKLKVDWSQNGSLSGAGATNSFRIEYSLNGGSSWLSLRDVSSITSSSSATSEVTLSNSQDVTQVRVRNRLLADAPEGSSASVTVSISNVRVEVSNNPPQMLLSSMM